MKKSHMGVLRPKIKLSNAIFKSLAIVTMMVFCQVGMAQYNGINQPNVNDIQAYSSTSKIENRYIVVLNDEKVNILATKMTSRNFSYDQARAAVVQDIAVSMAIQTVGLVKHTYSSAINGFVIETSASKKVAQLLNDPRVDFIEADQMVSASVIQNNATWGLDRIDQANLPLNSTYSYEYDGTNVNAYVIDSGVRISHLGFGSRGRNGVDFVTSGGNGTNDCNGHGTHVAGTIGSNIYGVAKKVNIYPVRVLRCDNTGYVSWFIAGVNWVVANHIKPAVANMSLYADSTSTSLDNAVNNAVSQGIIMVAAAANENDNACNYSPARVSSAITVGSTTNSDVRSSFSNFGACLDIFAPGSSITSTWSTSDLATNTISGTSIASPHVAGVVAMYLDKFPNATPQHVDLAIKSAAIPNKVIDAGPGSPNLLLNNFSDGIYKPEIDAYDDVPARRAYSDDVPGDAVPIYETNRSQHHNFHETGDVDWTIFTVANGDSYDVLTYKIGTASARMVAYRIDGDYSEISPGRWDIELTDLTVVGSDLTSGHNVVTIQNTTGFPQTYVIRTTSSGPVGSNTKYTIGITKILP